MNDPVRLNKYLAYTLGISRREADIRIEHGRVAVNGRVATLGNVIQPGRDKITVEGNDLSGETKRYTQLLINKPVGYVCSRKQQGTTPTVYSMIPRQYHHLKVAGRLDKDSCGLVLLTDDGDLIFKLTHPKFNKEKIYHVGLNKPLTADDKTKIESGVELEDGASKFSITKLSETASGKKRPNMYKVVMSEGRNRQIRRTFGSLRYMVTHLERQAFGPYKLSSLNNKPYLQI